MKLTRYLLSTISVSCLTIMAATPVVAEPAVLAGSQPGSRVNVRSGPSTATYSPHYGLVGDQVWIINQVVGDDGYAWFYVRFASGAEGWIRGDFISPLGH
ncbi:SH3 domain-containing protein [Acaryochloris sp. CCMEE 5410]|nr:SH3 domain-containing protein [Acaryochloris sp. CCMEE 5410]